MMDVAHHPDHGEPRMIEPAEFHALVERIFAGPDTPGRSFIDQDHSWSIGRIGQHNISAAKQADAQRRKKSWSDAVPLGAFVQFGIGVDLAFGVEAVAVNVATERNLACCSRGLHAGQCAQTLNSIREELAQDCIVAVSLAEDGGSHGEHVTCVEAG